MNKGKRIKELNAQLLKTADEIRVLCKELNIDSMDLIVNIINDTAEIEARLIESGNLEIEEIEE